MFKAVTLYFPSTKLMFERTFLLSVLLLAGCGAADPVNVQILPSQYRVGDVKSNLATPVVDEVVRLKAREGSHIIVSFYTACQGAAIQRRIGRPAQNHDIGRFFGKLS
jgi:hypothetical protein